MKCKPIFKNGEEEEYGEQKYVTVEMLQRFCRNDAYLKQETERLEYLTPPAVRKTFAPVLVDEDRSYGYMNGADNNIVFNGGEPTHIKVDWDNDIDKELTTATIMSKLEDGTVTSKVITPYSEGELNSSTKTGGECNHYERVSFNPDREYAVRPNWLQNPLNNEIPSIGQAQTWKAEASGVLEAITLNIRASQNEDLYNTASPLIVQIRRTTEEYAPEGLALNYDWEYNVLAQQEIRFHNTQPESCNIVFDNPCIVEEGETYTVVVLSPLSHPTHCYYLGCYDNEYNTPYEDGGAFYTQDNGMTWHENKNITFLFTAHIREAPNKYKADEDFYLYLKPIMHTGIISISVNCNDNGKVIYEASRNGRDWKTLNNNQTYGSRDAPLKWDMCFIRCRLNTDDVNTPAFIELMNLHLFAESSKEMYVRTIPYYPKTNPMLGASVWGRISTPFTVSDNAYCEAELISMKEAEETFQIIKVEDLEQYTYYPFINESKVKAKTPEQIARYLEDEPSTVEHLKGENIYILPYTKNNGETVFYFHQIGLQDNPAYPIISLKQENRNYGEWIDYIYNYGNEPLIKNIDDEEISIKTDHIYFYNDVLEEMDGGLLTIKYNPCYFKQLGSGELTLDYQEETIPVTGEMAENRRIQIQCRPVDPIRKITVNNEKELTETIDYTVNYNTKTIDFTVKNDEGETEINEGDTINITYTPNIEDTGLSIGYYATRQEANKKVEIKPNYFEYKV